MAKSYSNTWIPREAMAILDAETGRILDVGGGAAPFARASHIVDVLPFAAEALASNAWGLEIAVGGNVGGEARLRPDGSAPGTWTASQYTQLDLCEGRAWPFADRDFDLGVCSHCLEDLRDPIPAARELSRVCKKVLIVAPSRLLEQTRGVDHPRYCGFSHHAWMVFEDGAHLVFRRKTPVLMLPKCHLIAPFGRTLRREVGSMFYYAQTCQPMERMFWSEREDYEDYCRFIDPFRERRDLFVGDGRRHDLRYWTWQLRRRWLGAL